MFMSPFMYIFFLRFHNWSSKHIAPDVRKVGKCIEKEYESLLAFFIRVTAKVLFQKSEDKVLGDTYVIHGLCDGVHHLYGCAI